MSILISAPSEVIISIMQGCDDFKQLLSFTSTCKSIHSIWLYNSSQIISHIDMKPMPAFSDAVLVARTTKLVRDAFLSDNRMPNFFPLEKFSVSSRSLQLSELKTILDLDHLIKCLEIRCRTNCDYGRWGDFGDPHEFERTQSASELRVWRERFYRALYKLLLAGVILFEAYNEPFSKERAADRPPDFLGKYLRVFNNNRDNPDDWDWTRASPFSQEDYEYLAQFAVFNLNVEEAPQNGIFGPFAQWLVDDDKNRSKEEQFSCPLGKTREEMRPIRDTMLLVAAYEHMITKFTNSDGKSGYCRPGGEDAWPLMPEETRVRRVSVVMFGVFRLEEITMPYDVELSADYALIASPIRTTGVHGHSITSTTTHAESTPVTVDTVDINDILQKLYLDSRQPNHHDGYPAPHPPLQFFTFMLKKHFNMQFRPQAFEEHYVYQGFKLFIVACEIFNVRNDADGFNYHYENIYSVLQEYRAPELSYGYLSR